MLVPDLSINARSSLFKKLLILYNFPVPARVCIFVQPFSFDFRKSAITDVTFSAELFSVFSKRDFLLGSSFEDSDSFLAVFTSSNFSFFDEELETTSRFDVSDETWILSSSSSPSVGTGEEASLFFWRWLIITDLLRSTFSEKLFLITFGGKAGPNSSELLLIFRSNCFIKSTLFEAAEPCSVGALLLFVTVALLFVSFAAIRSFIEFSSPRNFEFSELDEGA